MNNVRPFRPQRNSRNKSFPTTIKILGNGEGALNTRLGRYIKSSKFPHDALAVEFRIEPRGDELLFFFSANGLTETWLLSNWRNIHDEIDDIRALPWKVFQTIFQILDPSAFQGCDDAVADRHGCSDPGSCVSLHCFINMRPVLHESYDLAYFRMVYFTVKVIWEHAKKVYKGMRKTGLKTWRQLVKSELEALSLPDFPKDIPALLASTDDLILEQLIDRLEKPESADGLISLQEKVKDRCIPATVQELALDHAAHLCGVPLYKYTARHLKTFIAIPKQ